MFALATDSDSQTMLMTVVTGWTKPDFWERVSHAPIWWPLVRYSPLSRPIRFLNLTLSTLVFVRSKKPTPVWSISLNLGWHWAALQFAVNGTETFPTSDTQLQSAFFPPTNPSQPPTPLIYGPPLQMAVLFAFETFGAWSTWYTHLFKEVINLLEVDGRRDEAAPPFALYCQTDWKQWIMQGGLLSKNG